MDKPFNREQLERWLWYLLVATRGGPTRARIIHALKGQAMNINQLAELLHLDYTTVQHHIAVLRKNKVVVAIGQKYAVTYFLSPEIVTHYDLFVKIWDKISKKSNSVPSRARQ